MTVGCKGIVMRLDVSPLVKAVGQLEKSLGFLRSDLAASEPALRDQFRAASIQAFEYVYELATKMIRRQLEQIVPNPSELREVSFLDLMRTAADSGLVRDPRVWGEYRELRNQTSQTYDEGKAEGLVARLEGFLQDARFTTSELERRNRGNG